MMAEVGKIEFLLGRPTDLSVLETGNIYILYFLFLVPSKFIAERYSKVTHIIGNIHIQNLIAIADFRLQVVAAVK